MDDSGKPIDELLVAVHRACALVRVRGRGSFKTGPALKRFGLSAIADGCERFILDMDECIGMDSTFMGVLAGLALRLKKQGDGKVIVMNLGAKPKSLLETLGLDRLLETYQGGELTDGLKAELACISGLSTLDSADPGKRVTLETMLAAHEDLVTASPDNLPKFRNVIDYLGEDLQGYEGS